MKHTKYGEGEIVRQYDNKMDIAFGAAVRCFLFPAAFENHIQALDAETKEIVQQNLNQLSQEKEKEKRQREVEMYRATFKLKPSDHAVFDIKENEITDIAKNWNICTCKAGKEPKIPLKLNMYSICFLTQKSRGEAERQRRIIGLFMTDENFIGIHCLDGQIAVHEKYHVLLDNQEPVYFWDFFEEEKRLKTWGSSRMKYVPTEIARKILEKLSAKNESALDYSEDVRTQIDAIHKYFYEIKLRG